jgi:hypothetical protein
MRYVVRTFLGMALFAFCWVVIGYGIYQLLQIGTCASGGPYVSARQCPDGTGAIFLALPAGIFGMFAAAGLYVGRGKPPGSSRPPRTAAIVVWFWTGLFWSLGAGGLLAAWGPEAMPGPGGKLGGLIVGFMGVVMGAGGLLALRFRRPRTLDPQILNPAFAAVVGAASRFSGAAQPVDRIDKLDRLRNQGALTDAEFELLKSKIVRED